MASLFLISPILLSALGLGIWATFPHSRWSPHLSRVGWITPLLSIGLYCAGFLLGIIGDTLYIGSGEPFDWGSHHALTLPMMIIGFLLAPLSAMFNFIVGAIDLLKKHR